MAKKGSGVGNTRDIVGKRVGIGTGKTYEKASKVVSAIDEALLVGNVAKAEALRKTLNHKSVSAAFKMISSIENISETQHSETQHTQMQWILAKLGQQLCGSVWIASNDRSRIWQKEELGSLSMDSLPQLGIRDDAQKTIAFIDVVWLSGDNQLQQLSRLNSLRLFTQVC
ncbi:hypothetical protein [Nostoc commune]|nr:hypothetical protein [Nostoc commune]